MTFAEQVIMEARQAVQRIVFPEAEDIRILEAVAELDSKGIVKPVLVGDPKKISRLVKKEDILLQTVEIVEPTSSPYIEKFAKALYERRKKKGMTLKQAKEIVLKPDFFGAMLVKFGHAEGMVSGAVHTTKQTLHAAIYCIGIKPKIKTASSMFFMELARETIIFADCGFVIDPDSSQLADITTETVKTAKQFGIKPRVAMLSFSTHSSARHPDIDKVVEATKIVRKRNPKLEIDGDLQFDAAYIPEIQRKKAPKSPLKGKPANIFIFPDLDSGNIGYKIAERIGGANAYGPILQGFNHPVNDLSRGCSVDDIIIVSAITAVQAQKRNQR